MRVKSPGKPVSALRSPAAVDAADKARPPADAPAAPAADASAPQSVREARGKGPKKPGSREVAQRAGAGSARRQTEQARSQDPKKSSKTGGPSNATAGLRKAFEKAAKDGELKRSEANKLAGKVEQGGISEQEIATLASLQNSAAGKALSAPSRKRLQTTITGLLSKYHEQPEVDRKQILSELSQNNLRWLASEQAERLGLGLTSPRPFSLSGPLEDTNKSFDGRKGTPALKYQLNIDGRTIDIVQEQPPVSGQHTPADIASALSQVRPELLKHVNRVELLNKPDGQAAMQTNYGAESGTIEVLPYGQGTTREAAHVLNHEIGHLQSRGALGYDPAQWSAYEQAIAADGRHPSRYAQTSPTEDFSEFLTLHEIFRGTPEAGAFQALFPNRYAAMGHLLT